MKTGEIACAVPDLHDYRLYDHRTGEPLDPVEAETLLWLHLDHCRQCQNRMIHDPRNRNLKRGGNAGRGNEWARKNVACTSLPSKFRNLSHQNRVNQTEAARLLLAWREREDIATAIDAIGWEKATYGNVQKRLSRDIDRELFTNVLNSGGHPSLPTVERTQFPYAYSNNNSCGMYVIDQPAGVIRYERMAVYDRFVDVEIYAPHIMHLHPNLTKVSRPTLRWNRDCVTWDVIVFEPKPRKEDVNKVSHVVGFDLNADWHGGISGARLSYNGMVSRELVAGIDTRRQQTVLEELYVQYQRCLKKLDRLMPWQRPHDPDDPQQVAAHPEWRRLYEQSLNLRDKMYRIKTLLDWRYAHDITDHAKPGELIAVEKLSPFDAAGRVEFRHGSQLEKLEHVASKTGQRVVQVNPAHTSATCPWCDTVNKVGKARQYRCAGCRRDIHRDYGSGVNIAKRGARYLGHKTVRPTPPKGHATPKRPPVRHKRPDEKTRELLTQITSGTGKGPESLWAKTTPLEWHIPSTATIENTRNRLALANQRDRTATGLRQKPQPPHSR